MTEGSTNVPVKGFVFGTCHFQRLNQDQMGEIIGFSGIGGALEGAFAATHLYDPISLSATLKRTRGGYALPFTCIKH